MELQHISEWAMRHNFTLNETKNKNYYQLAENSYTCVTCSNSRVEFLKVLCISFNTKLSFEPHISYIIQSAARSFYGLKTLRAHGLTGKSLRDVTQATLIARIFIRYMLHLHGRILKCCGEGPHRVGYQ